jgi:YggT family protein
MLLAGIIQIFVILITIDVVLSLAMIMGTRISMRHPMIRALHSITEPLYMPVRRLLPPPSRTGGLDIAPMIVVMLLQLLKNIILTL